MQQGWQFLASLQDQTKQLEEQQWILQYKIDDVQSHHRNTRLELLGKQLRQEEAAAAAEERFGRMFHKAWTAAFESAAAAAMEDLLQRQMRQQQHHLVYPKAQVAAAAHNDCGSSGGHSAVAANDWTVNSCPWQQQQLRSSRISRSRAVAAAAASSSGSSSRSLVPRSQPCDGNNPVSTAYYKEVDAMGAAEATKASSCTRRPGSSQAKQVNNKVINQVSK